MTHEIVGRVLELAIEIQQIHAPTFDERERGEFMRARFLEEGLQDVSKDEAGNIYGRWAASRGQKPTAPPLIVSAHLDTVFTRGTDLSITRDTERIHGAGIGDNSMGVAALLGILWGLRARGANLPGDVWFVADTCEEGLGDLRGMKSVVDRFRENVTAYLIVEGMAFGHVYHRAAAVQRYRINARTAGGHAWSDYGQPSAVHELAALTTRIASLHLLASPRTTLNVGRIEGGTSVNTVAAEACLELDMRSESPEALAELVSRVDQLIGRANRTGVRVEAESIGLRPGGEISVEHPLIQLAASCVREQGIEPRLVSGSTDANVPLSRGLPALVMGVTTGGGAHTPGEFVDVEPVARGIDSLAEFVVRAFGLQA